MHEPHERVQAFLAQLVDNHNLFSLSVHIAFLDEHACRATMSILKQVLLSCPHLARIPMLYVGRPVTRIHGILDGPGLEAPYCGLGLSGGKIPPALEDFGLADYPWGREPTAALAAGGIYCIGYLEKGNEVQYWVERFDWSRLRRLNSIPSKLALGIAPKLRALKEIIFDETIDTYYIELTAFLEQIPTALELLTIPSWSYIGNKHGAITQHGAALRKLTIYCLEPWEAKSLLTDTDLVTLCSGLPHIEGVDLGHRQGQRMGRLALQHARNHCKLSVPPKHPIMVRARHSGLCIAETTSRRFCSPPAFRLPPGAEQEHPPS
jgi:hypothetical protein